MGPECARKAHVTRGAAVVVPRSFFPVLAALALSGCYSQAAMHVSTPLGPVTLSSSSGTVSCANTPTFTASEAGYSGTFTATNANPTFVAVTQAGNTFTVGYGTVVTSGIIRSSSPGRAGIRRRTRPPLSDVYVSVTSELGCTSTDHMRPFAPALGMTDGLFSANAPSAFGIAHIARSQTWRNGNTNTT